MNWDEQITKVESIGGNRRADRRYDLRLELRWKLIRRRRILEAGQGNTIDFSSGGVYFEATRPMPVGLNVELSISWPVLLHNVAPLQLVVTGKIVRSDGLRTAIHMTQHEFRTVAVPADRRNVTGSRPLANAYPRQAIALGR